MTESTINYTDTSLFTGQTVNLVEIPQLILRDFSFIESVFCAKS